ncbi:MAG: arylamine N-acetyltransferase, partial [Sphingomonadales bacterium]|nr:arylamine N-acetyltransferase [Sphingomonadales bacterium]
MTSPDRLAAYLRHLRLDAPPEPTSEGLARVQAAHRETIGFANFELLLGAPVRIDSEAAFDKLIARRRGGFCFEQNRLYSDMLTALDMPNRALLARVRLGLAPDDIPPRTHVLLLVELEGGLWIADAGFGGSFVPPMPLVDGTTAHTGDGAAHRLTRIGASGDLMGQWLLERAGPPTATDGRAAQHLDWQPQYTFDLAPVAQADLDQGSHWAATRPYTRFTTLHIASIALPDGFASLLDTSLSLYRGSATEKRELVTPQDYLAALGDLFGFDYSAEEVAALPL